MAKTRINLYFDDEILKNVDNEAKQMGVSRTAAISMIVSQYLQQKKTVDVASNMMDIIKSNTNLDSQTTIFDAFKELDKEKQ